MSTLTMDAEALRAAARDVLLARRRVDEVHAAESVDDRRAEAGRKEIDRPPRLTGLNGSPMSARRS
jgi:hypothetical protein